MMEESAPGKFKFMAIGGVIGGVLSSIPCVSALNCCFCLLVGIGSYLSVKLWLDADASTKLSTADAAALGAGSGAIAGVENWPLTRNVLFVKPGSDLPNQLSMAVRIPPKARLRTAAGVHPDRWQSLGPFPLRLGIEIRSPRGSETLYREQFDVFGNPKTRIWQNIDVDLSAWAGEEVEIVFLATALGWEAGQKDIAGFAEPIILSSSP